MSLTQSQRARNEGHVGMVSAVWEDARLIASRSAQLLHAIAALHHSMLKDSSEEEKRAISNDDIRSIMDNLLKEQKDVQILLGKRWDSLRISSQQALHQKKSQVGENIMCRCCNNILM